MLPERPTTTERWNTYEISAHGTRLTVRLNGRTTADVDETNLALPAGTIQLHAGGPDGPGRVLFRNIKIRPAT